MTAKTLKTNKRKKERKSFKMRDEIAAAVVFVSRLLKRNRHITAEQVDRFSDQLSGILLERFKNHWHTDVPNKGQAYRCIRINECEPVDPVLLKAARESGIAFHELELPSEITLWVDPSEVSCRIGETKSAYCTVASVRDGKLDNRACKLDLEDLISEHNRKKEEDLNKLKEFTTERRSPTLYPGHVGPFMDMSLHYQPSGEVHLPFGSGGPPPRWNNGNKHLHGGNHHIHQSRRPSPPNSATKRNRSPPLNGTPPQNGGVFGSMKTGHHQGSANKYQWTNGNKNTTAPAKA